MLVVGCGDHASNSMVQLTAPSPVVLRHVDWSDRIGKEYGATSQKRQAGTLLYILE